MIEVFPNLHISSEQDEQCIRGTPGWFVIHACKEPYHHQKLGYSGRAAAKDHPEYLIARRPGRLILNLVDVDDVKYIDAEVVNAALAAIQEKIGSKNVLVHCKQGASRSPTIAFPYLAKSTDAFSDLTIDEALAAFRALYTD